MNIKINNGTPKEYLIRNKFLWDITMKKPFILTLILLGLGIIILMFGIFQPYSFTSDLEKNISYYDFYGSIGFGVNLILLALLFLNVMRKKKRAFYEAVNLYIRRAEAVKNYESNIIISSDSIKFSNFEETVQTNWTAFIFYKVIKGYVILYKSKAISPYMIDLSRMSPEDKNEFEKFLNGKLPKVAK